MKTLNAPDTISGKAGRAYAHYALHRLKILPGALMALPLRERAFIYASIDLQVEKEKKEQKRAAARRGKKGR